MCFGHNRVISRVITVLPTPCIVLVQVLSVLVVAEHSLGVWGLLLGVPIIVVIKVIAEHIEGLQSVAELLGE